MFPAYCIPSRGFQMARACCALGAIFVLSSLPAQTAAPTGSIEGRVMNRETGDYLERARLTIEGTPLETFSDNQGEFLFGAVPTGVARVKVFYTGLAPETLAVNVSGGQTATLSVNLTPLGKARPADASPVKMSEFVVATSKEMDGAAIAINEQRFAANIRNVIAADEFGPQPDGNVGELIKFLPGVAVGYVAGDARQVSLNGVPYANVPVTVNGFNLASSQNNTQRYVDLGFASTNNISRIEVVTSPTPESPGAALAGSVNMVPRSAFERAKPSFNGSAFVIMRDDARSFGRPKPGQDPTRKVFPGFEFSYLRPVNQKFGFTFSASHSTQYQSSVLSQNTWRGGGTATNGTSLPDTTPDKPYLSDYAVQDNPRQLQRSSAGATIDYKLGRHDRVSFSFQAVRYKIRFSNHTLAFAVNRVLPGDFSTTFTHGAAGAGELRLTNSARDRISFAYMPTLLFRHDGPVWRGEAGLGHSSSETRFRDIAKGFFNNSVARRTGVVVSFDDIFYLRPNRITVVDSTTGAPVDPYNLDNYAIASANSDSDVSRDMQRSAYANLGRDFDWRVPVTLKAGVDVRQSVRDFRDVMIPFNFVGADNRASTAPVGSDDGARVVLDENFSARVGPFGFPKIQWVDNDKLYRLYRAHPSYFTVDEAAAYRSTVNVSKYTEEVISSAFLRGDVHLLDRRLKLIGGLRAEQTNVRAEGPLTDPAGNFRRDANGRFVLGPNGRPLPITNDPLVSAQLTLLDRGRHTTKEYIRYFPSLNASYNLRENLITRAAYYFSVGRPDFNQYAGALTLPDTSSPPSPSNRINVNNPAIKAWTARTAKVTLEYYFQGVGLFSVSGFRRDFENFFGNTVFTATPEFLALNSLNPDVYGGYEVTTQHNIESTVRMEGFDFNYKQALTFLPHWARGVQVFANGTAQRAIGDATANVSGYIPRSGSWGVSLTRERYLLRMNWNYFGRRRLAKIADGRSIDPATYTWGARRLSLDFTGELKLTRRFAAFVNLRNLNDATDDMEIYNPRTPEVAQFRQRGQFGALWTLGIKGTF